MDKRNIGPMVLKIIIAVVSAVAGAFGWSLTM